MTHILGQNWDLIPKSLQIPLTVLAVLVLVGNATSTVARFWTFVKTKYAEKAHHKPAFKVVVEVWRFITFVGTGYGVLVMHGWLKGLFWVLLFVHLIGAFFDVLDDLYHLKVARRKGLVSMMEAMAAKHSETTRSFDPHLRGLVEGKRIDSKELLTTLLALSEASSSSIETFLQFVQHEWRPTKWQIARAILSVVAFWIALGIATIPSSVAMHSAPMAQPVPNVSTHPTTQP